MNESWQNSSVPPSDHRPSGRGRRPRRSAFDRKVAGVAGGLGRSLGVDPVLLRVAFVVLTFFGGSGVLLYALGWLLMPGEHDEVSAAEALLGRGRSSVPPILAVGLAVVSVISLFSMFSWGLPFEPVLIAAVIAYFVMKRRGRRGCSRQRDWSQQGGARAFDNRRWEQRAERHAQHWSDRADRWARQASQWGDQAERWVATQPWNGTSNPSPKTSPFEQPAFWDQPAPQTRVDAPPAGPRVRMTKDAPGEQAGSNPDPADTPRTPPAWDPLGAAPFAWDLPEPGPATPPPPARGRGVGSRVTMGLTLLAGGLAAAGVFAGWWSLTWAQVAAIALTVVGLGLLVSALRGRGYSLIGPGIFLSLVTLALTMTGIRGTDGFGEQTWAPTTVAQVQAGDPGIVNPNVSGHQHDGHDATAGDGHYIVNAGQGTLDLSGLVVPTGTTVPITLDVRAGHADVTLPANTAVDATCHANAGEVECLGQNANGLHTVKTAVIDGDAQHGKIDLTVNVGAGFAEVH